MSRDISNASLAVAKNPGKQYNPILIYGGSGLGKTHLMHAIGNYIYNHGGEKLKICYVSAESFTNEFILSTKEKSTDLAKIGHRFVRDNALFFYTVHKEALQLSCRIDKTKAIAIKDGFLALIEKVSARILP